MRRILAFLILTLAGTVAAQAQVTNPVTAVFKIGTGGSCATTACTSGTRQLCRNSTTATVMYACDTSTGFYVDVGSIASGSRLNLEGPTGDTYLIRDASVPSLDAYYDGVLRAQIRPTVLAPGNCPTNIDTMETGFCLLNGRLTYRDSTGIYFLTGAVVIQ